MFTFSFSHPLFIRLLRMQSSRPALFQAVIGPETLFILRTTKLLIDPPHLSLSKAAMAADITAASSAAFRAFIGLSWFAKKDILHLLCRYSGIFPCFFSGSDSRFEASISKALMISGLVIDGSMTSST